MARPKARRAEARAVIRQVKLTGGSMLDAVAALQRKRRIKKAGGPMGEMAKHGEQINEAQRILPK